MAVMKAAGDHGQATGLPVAAVARRLGIAAATLRTWDRRYGLGPSVHEAGKHRRYNETDLERLAEMRRLTLEGLPTSEAASRALSVHPAPGANGPARQRPATPDGRRMPGSPGGGAVLAMGDADTAARGLGRAAFALDFVGCVQIVSAETERRGVVRCWEEILVPVLAAVGERYAATGGGIDAEHLLSEAILAVLRPDARTVATGPSVLLASAENDLHVLPVYALASALAEHGVAVRVLGARTPAAALATAVRRSRPAAIFVWSQLPETGNPAQLETLPRLRPQPRLCAGGPGWAQAALPPGASRPKSLAAAVADLLAAVGR